MRLVFTFISGLRAGASLRNRTFGVEICIYMIYGCRLDALRFVILCPNWRLQLYVFSGRAGSSLDHWEGLCVKPRQMRLFKASVAFMPRNSMRTATFTRIHRGA